MPKEQFSINVNKLFNIIKNSSGSFEASEINDFNNEIQLPVIKAKSLSKRDIMLVMHDIKTSHKI